jgi:hypothetical protein
MAQNKSKSIDFANECYILDSMKLDRLLSAGTSYVLVSM